MKRTAWFILAAAPALSISGCLGCNQNLGEGEGGGWSVGGVGQTGSTAAASTGAGAGSSVHNGGANRPPLARGDSQVAIAPQQLLYWLTENDTDPDGDTLMRIGHTQPAYGMGMAIDDELYYRPQPGFVGEDMLTYDIEDSYGATDTAEIYVHVPATAYYVSPSGDDGGAGTSDSTPWRTLGRVQTALCGGAVGAGDIIRLQRHGVWRESLQTCNRTGQPGKPIVISAYGVPLPATPDPIIAGSDAVTGWIQDPTDEGVWTASVTGPVADLYWNGARQTPARFPNTGWLLNKPATPGQPAQINSDGLTGMAGFYVGATLRMRTVNWAYESRLVTASSPGHITLDSPPTHDVSDGGWGFFLDGKRAFLESPGEWFHDATTGTLYFYPPDGAVPKDGLVEAVVRNRVLEITDTAGAGTYFVVDSVTLRHAAEAALVVSAPARHVAVRHLEITDSYSGMRAFTDDVTVTGVQFARTRESALWLVGANNRVERSEFTDIAVDAGYGEPLSGYVGVHLQGDNWVARQNILDGIGHTGIAAGGNNVLLEENVVRRSNVVLNDGASIAFSNGNGLTVRRNILTEPVGLLDGVSPAAGPLKSPYRPILFGISFGNGSVAGAIIEGNVAAQHTTGIRMDHAMASAVPAVVRDNVLFGNSDQQVMFTDRSASSCVSSYGEDFTGNTLMSADPSQKIMFHENVQCPAPVDWGTFNANRYYAPYGDVILDREQVMDAQYTRSYTLAEWQVDSGQDMGSQTLPAALQLAPNVKPILEDNFGRTVRKAMPVGAWQWPDGTAVTMPIEIPSFSAIVLLPQ